MNPSTGRGLRTALVAALCALFFLLAMGITLLGSSVYRETVASSDANYTQRTALSYLVNQVRRAGGVAVGTFESYPALDLSESGASPYHTILYAAGGELRELYTERGSGLTSADGSAVLSVEELSIVLEDGVLTFTITQDEQSWSASVAPRTGVREIGEVEG